MDLVKTKYRILVQRFKNRIYGYALYMVKNRMDAEDITQEALIRVWQNINKFKVRAAASYIMRITHNLSVDCLRRRTSFESKNIYIDEQLFEVGDERNIMSPDETAHITVMNEKIKLVIGSLPEKLKSPFVLYEIEGLKYKEIGKVLDIPLSSVKTNILRARKKIQEELKNYEKLEVL